MANLSSVKVEPLRRYVSTVEPQLCPPDALTDGSLNMLIDPITGGAFKRGGSAIVGDSVNGTTHRATAGILASAPEFVPARLRSFYSDALADGASGGTPTHSVLYRKEASSTSWPTVDDGVFGTEYVRRTSANYTLYSEFGSAAYPTATGAFGSAHKYRVVPWWYESGEGGYNRGAFEFVRRFAVPGSWDTIDAGRWRYYPSLRGTPIRWDGGCNNDNATVNNVIRSYPTGPFGPMWPFATATATTSTASATTTKDYPWKDGDTFYFSVMFQFEDGSYSLPFFPRPTTPNLTAGLGLVVVGTEGGGNVYKSVVYTGIPLGPPGTVARVLLRTPLTNRAASTTAVSINISDLRICGILDNNTQTGYTDTLAVDSGLTVNTDLVRFDLICPPRAQHIGTGDNRAIVGKTLPNPCAIQLTCIGVGTSFSDVTFDEENAGLRGATGAFYRVTSAQLEVCLSDGTNCTTNSYSWASYPTLQELVDIINASSDVGAASAHYGQWRAALAPGADPNAPSSGLCPTVWTVTCDTHTNTTLDGGDISSVPLGYKVVGTDIPTGASTPYLVSKESATSGTLSGAATGTHSGSSMTFYADCGDSAWVPTAKGYGWIRTFGSAIPGMVYFKRTALANYNRVAKDRIYFTTSSPGAAATGVSLAPNSYVRSNRRDGVQNPGPVMGIVDVQGAAVIVYRDKTALFVNERGSNTGEDFDYRIQTINQTRGSCSPWSVFGVNGCAIYASSVGIEATDKSKRTIKLSSDIYEPVRGRGDLAYEIPLCIAAAAADSPDCWMSGASWGPRLVYSYRDSASAYRFIVYDFSPGVDSLGVDSLADPVNRKSYGWSAPMALDWEKHEFGPRALGSVARSGGVLLYGALNDNYGTADGRVDQLMTGDDDNGTLIHGTAFSATALTAPGMKFSVQNATIQHKVGYTGVRLYVHRTKDSRIPVSLTSAEDRDYHVDDKEWPQAARSPGDRMQLELEDFTANTGGLWWTTSVEVESLVKCGGR
jgi:hypothetical protein